MAQLSIQEVVEFADDLSAIAQAIGNFRLKGRLGNGQILTRQQKDHLLNSQIQLLRDSATFYAQAVTVNSEAIKSQLDELREVATTIDHVMSKITDIQKAMDIAALAANVAASAIIGNVPDTADSLGKFLQNIYRVKV